MIGGHYGIKKTCNQLQRRPYWISWRKDCERFVRRCPQCATYRRGKPPRLEQYYGMRVDRTSFQKHDWVWYLHPRRRIGKSPKWQRLYTGPYLVTKKLGPVNYLIQKSARSDPIVVHVDKLKTYIGDTPMSWLLNSSSPTPEDANIDDCEMIRQDNPGNSLRSPNAREISQQSTTKLSRENDETDNSVTESVNVDNHTEQDRSTRVRRRPNWLNDFVTEM
jgi:Integrase zinc binding domain